MRRKKEVDRRVGKRERESDEEKRNGERVMKRRGKEKVKKTMG